MTLYKVTNPATGKVESEFPTATDVEIRDILGRSDAAYRAWRRSEASERVAVLRRVADLTEKRSAELGMLATREMGKTTAEADGELMFTVGIYRYYADQAEALLADQPLPSNLPGKAVIRRAPIGALLGVMPWNFPFYQVARFAAPNLLLGNTIVLKHAPQCPESALAQEAIFAEAGLPSDAYINVFATNEQVAELIADARIAGVSVTGSERAGTVVAALAGQHLKKVVLELGGSDPFIVLDADDLPSVVQSAVAARMENAGQSCNAAKRFIISDEIYDDFSKQFTAAMASLVTGDPLDPSTSYGPLSSATAADTLIAQIEDAVSKGATLLTGGHRLDGPGAFVAPTVLADVTPDMRAYHEELFGPAAVVYRVAGKDEAIELVNGSSFGLGGAVFSRDVSLAMEVADQLDVGMVWINQPEGGGPELPFGGTKRSGIGRELGPLGIDEFANKKLVHTVE